MHQPREKPLSQANSSTELLWSVQHFTTAIQINDTLSTMLTLYQGSTYVDSWSASGVHSKKAMSV